MVNTKPSSAGDIGLPYVHLSGPLHCEMLGCTSAQALLSLLHDTRDAAPAPSSYSA